MSLVSPLRQALFLLVPLSLILTSYLYYYPFFHQCAFSAPGQDAHSSYLQTLRQHAPFSGHDSTAIAPFRLLALGDPQLEGDSSIAGAEARNFPNFHKFWNDVLCLDGTRHNLLQRIRHGLHDLIDFYLDDIPKTLNFIRKRIDHVGNDYYLGHIYRTLHWWTDPTHVTALGDLVGSQWISDEEFERRGWRFWNRVFKTAERVPEELASQPSDDFPGTLTLGSDAAAWKRRMINVAGNHDIGYAGDLSPERMKRFIRVFGKANYEIRFQQSIQPSNSTEGVQEDKTIPELRIVVLNDMNLDTPASSSTLQDETYKFLNSIITTSHPVSRPAHFTLVLTHIPLYKPAGICVDGPFFDFFDGEFNNGVREQNHLSVDGSKGFLEGIFGMSGNPGVDGNGYGRRGVIINGHDHEGCDVYHYINQSSTSTSPNFDPDSDPDQDMEPQSPTWQSKTFQEAQFESILGTPNIPGMREITVRSMMGSYGGNAGLLSLWFDRESWQWTFEFANCRLGKQHVWWTVHILDLITIGVVLVYGGLSIAKSFGWGFEGDLGKGVGADRMGDKVQEENKTMPPVAESWNGSFAKGGENDREALNGSTNGRTKNSLNGSVIS